MRSKGSKRRPALPCSTVLLIGPRSRRRERPYSSAPSASRRKANGFRDQARSLARGLESELSIALDPMFPMPIVVDALKAFSDRFPSVPPHVHVRSLGAAAQLVIDGACAIGMLPFVISDLTPLKTFPLLTIELVPVVAPTIRWRCFKGPLRQKHCTSTYSSCSATHPISPRDGTMASCQSRLGVWRTWEQKSRCCWPDSAGAACRLIWSPRRYSTVS